MKQFAIVLAAVISSLFYSPANFAQTHLTVYEANGKYGYIDKRGTIVIPARFDSVQSFQDGAAPVLVDSKWGIINERGEFIVTPRFEEISAFSEGLAIAELNGKWGAVDTDGIERINFKFAFLGDFKEGLAKFSNSKKEALGENLGKKGFINKMGEIVISPSFDSALDFSEGLSAVQINGKWGFINRNGNLIIKTQFDWALSFSEGFAPVKAAEKIGFIDKNGEMIIEPKFQDANNFSEGLASVEIGNKCGYINKKGVLKINAEFEECKNFSEGLAAVKVASYQNGAKKYNWGFINKTGKFIVQPLYRTVVSFSGGIGQVFDNQKRTYVNNEGVEIVIQ
jgi:hypothetical protein